MSTEFGETVAKKLTKQLPKEEIGELISNFFKEQAMCTIATCKDNIPRATPLECFADGLTLYISADPGTKVENVKVNPMVAIAMCNQIHPDWSGDNWKAHKSIQLVGKATLLDPDAPENLRAKKEVIKSQAFVKALGRDTSQPSRGWVIKVEPRRIEYFEMALMLKGYAGKQIWEA
jgi:nitroimidazol reductase NimA-like FMN-containing flavoprotein (pyridoxamine 5'-phosphate oxidase superfamily)